MKGKKYHDNDKHRLTNIILINLHYILYIYMQPKYWEYYRQETLSNTEVEYL